MHTEYRSMVKAKFSRLSDKYKVSLLVILALRLTINARETYSEQDDKERGFVKLVGFNEIQHSIAGQVAKMLNKDEKRYPDDVLLDIIFEKAESHFCTTDLFNAFNVAFNRLNT